MIISSRLSARYDRERITMASFVICRDCQNEYADPLDRRFHVQTIACPRCGPGLFLADQRGFQVPSNDPAREAGKIIAEAAIVAIKGNGDFHIAASASLDHPLSRLREAKHRAQKSFAVMSQTLEASALASFKKSLENSYQLQKTATPKKTIHRTRAPPCS